MSLSADVSPLTEPLSAPMPQRLAGWRDTALQAALFTLGVFLPFSSAGVSLSLAAILVLALGAAPAVWRCRPWREPTVASGWPC